MRESASAHEERAAAQAADLRLLYHISGCMLCFLFIFVRKQQPDAVVARLRREGKMTVRGGEAMAAKRTAAQECAAKCDRFCAGAQRAGAGSGSRVWGKEEGPAFAGLITSLRRPTFLALRK